MPFCTHCGSNNPENATFCVGCGRQLTAPPPIQSEPQRNRWLLPLLAAGIAMIVAMTGIVWATTRSGDGVHAEGAPIPTEQDATPDTTTATTVTSTTASITDLNGRTITVAVESDYPPHGFTPEGGTVAQGWDYDVWNEICRRLNCTAEFVETTWPDILVEIGQGLYDVAADGISITEERKEIMAFSDPYMVLEKRLLARKTEARFSTTEEFLSGGWRLGTEAETVNHELATSLLGGDALIHSYADLPTAIEALLAGEVDAVIIDGITKHKYTGPASATTKVIDGTLQTDSLGFAFPKDGDLIDPVNHTLKEMQDDGTLHLIIERWFRDLDG